MDGQTTLAGPSDGLAVPPALQESLDALHNRLKDAQAGMARAMRAQETHEVSYLRSRLASVGEALAAAQEALEAAALALAAAPPGHAVGPGYGPALEAELRRANLAFEGAYPEYEVFPLLVRVNPEGEWVRIGRKTVQTLDPRTVVRAVEREHRRLHRSAFNANRFLGAVATCYDALSRGQAGAAVALIDIYGLLSARTGPAGYTRQEFAFDIFRVRRQSDLVVDGRRLAFVHGKKGTKIAVPRAQGGVEEFTAAIMTPVYGHA